MERILIKNLVEFKGQKCLIKGFLHKKREVSSKLAFVVIRDRSGLVQVVIENNDVEIEKIKGLQNGAIIYVTGIVKEDKRATIGVEIAEPVLDVVVPITEVPPIEIDKDINHNPESFDILFDNRVLNLRNPKEASIFKIKATMIQAIRSYLIQNEFAEIQTPKIISGATEGGAEVFEVQYFDRKAVLAQSPQFYKQIMVGSLERVFEIGNAYRAEPSFTTRHLTETIMLDIEMGFLKDFDELLNVSERMLNFVCDEVWAKHEVELLALGAKKHALTEKFPTYTLTELHELFFTSTGIDHRGEDDCSPEEERWICEYSAEKNGCEAVFISEFPSSDMKFYQKKMEGKEEVTERVDLLFRGLELATMPMREHRYDKIISQMQDDNLDINAEGYKHYLQAFKHGLPPHGGFGFGIDRFLKQIIGLGSIKEAVLFPRDVKRLAP
jgi:nondiscriminating aspartyl-tRNA synthetase